MEIRLTGICLDCRDADEMARFYAAVFGWEEVAGDDETSRLGGAGWICMSGPPGGPTVSLQACGVEAGTERAALLDRVRRHVAAHRRT